MENNPPEIIDPFTPADTSSGKKASKGIVVFICAVIKGYENIRAHSMKPVLFDYNASLQST